MPKIISRPFDLYGIRCVMPQLYLISALVVIATLTGCATPASVEKMTAPAVQSLNNTTNLFKNNISVRDVTGGKGTNPLWASEVSSSAFSAALEASLKNSGLHAPSQTGNYFLTAHLQSLDKPFIGAGLTVTSSVQYYVTERKSGKDVYNKTIVSKGFAALSDALIFIERQKLANEYSIKNNITDFITGLLTDSTSLLPILAPVDGVPESSEAPRGTSTTSSVTRSPSPPAANVPLQSADQSAKPQQANAPVSQQTTNASTLKQGSSAYAAEELAKRSGCTTKDGLRPYAAPLQISGAIEVYDIECTTKRMTVRCDRVACKALE